MESIGRRIRNERERQGLTQDELARKMGYKNRSVVSTMEAATELSLKKVKKVAESTKSVEEMEAKRDEVLALIRQ